MPGSDWLAVASRPLVRVIVFARRVLRAALCRNAALVRKHLGIDAALTLLRDAGPYDNSMILSALGAHIERDVMIHSPVNIHAPDGRIANLSVGRGAHIGPGVFIDLTDRVTIGANATISMRSTILTHFDAGRSVVADARPRMTAPVTVDRDAYLGANTTVLAGVTIGIRAIVGAGAVVTADVPANDVVAGVPARRLSSSRGIYVPCTTGDHEVGRT
jgi:acetyltransferase-like isoleucine patch superfamily enzyme